MKFVCAVRETGGGWTGEHTSPGIGPVRVSGTSRQEVLQKLEAEIRYWLEMCPCTGERYRDLQIDLLEQG